MCVVEMSCKSRYRCAEDKGSSFGPAGGKSGMDPAIDTAWDGGGNERECEICKPVPDCGAGAGECDDYERAGWIKGYETF